MNDTWMESSTNNVSDGKHISIGSDTEASELAMLENEIDKVEVDFEKYAEDNFDFSRDLNEQKEELSKFNKAYCIAMAGLCLAPLRKGVNSKSVLRVIGLWVGCCFFSKTFRQETNKVITNVMHPLMEKRSEKEDSFVAKRKHAVITSKGFLPTPDTLAVMKIAFCKQAYEKMHEKKANVDAIMQQYDKAVRQLDAYAVSTGIRPDSVNKSMRKIASDLMDKDPTFIVIFEETGYDTVLRGEKTVHQQKYRVGDEVKVREWSAWEGEYLDRDGNAFTGGFTPRKPASVNDIRRRSKETWYTIMSGVKTPEAWGEAVVSDEARGIQRRYLDMICDDNGIDKTNVKNLNDYMDANDDVTWMIDIDGSDPFGVGSYDASFKELITKGPEPDNEQLILGHYPEFKSAYCKWLNNHKDMSPYDMQRRANDTYQEYVARGKKDTTLVARIAEYVEKRDALKSRWDTVFDDITCRVNEIDKEAVDVKRASRRELRPLPDVPSMESELSR